MNLKKGLFILTILLKCINGISQPGGYVNSNVHPHNNNGTQAMPRQTANITTKMPTNDWWTSIAWSYWGDDYSGELYAHPLSFKAQNDGLRIRTQINPAIAAGFSYHFDRDNGINTDFIVSMPGLNATDTKVDAFSDWSVTADWNDGTRNLKATMGHGFPYAYFTKSGGNAGIWFYTTPSATWGGGDAIGVTVNGSHYGIFIPTGSTWNFAGNWWESTLGGQNYFSIAALPDNSAATLSFYKQRAFAFITNTRVDWSYDPSSSLLTTTYTATVTPREAGQNTALLGLYRHQWLNVPAGTVNTAYTYSPRERGLMRVVAGNTFITQMRFNGVLPVMAGTITDATYNNNLNNYINTVTIGTAGSDTYWAGKWLGRLAQLVQLAEQQGGATAARFTTFLNSMKAELEDWFTPGGKEFRYNSNWGTLIGYPASFGSETQLNDHHFHYGYMIMAAAIVARYDQAWAARNASGWGGMVENIIKDVANWDIAADNRFPRLRNFDIYAGHSWASGHGANWRGNDHESISEAINFATAVILWGVITCQPHIRDLGIYLYTHEVAACEQYWFDINKSVFPAEYGREMASIICGNGARYDLHWDPPGNNVTEIHGIVLLPVTGGSLYLGRNPAYINPFLNEMHTGSNVGGINGTWRDIFWSFEAFNQNTSETYNAPAAVARFNANTGYTPESGESKAHTYHWINNLNNLGQLHPTITGDIPTSAVFIKGSVISYVAFNPPCNTGNIIVTFTDGTCMEVAPNELKTQSNLPDCSLPVNLLEFKAEALYDGASTEVNLRWTTISEKDNKGFRVYRNMYNDPENFLLLDDYNSDASLQGKKGSRSLVSYSYNDQNVDRGNSYTYKLVQEDFDGNQKSYYTSAYTKYVEEDVALYQNYPNPFSSHTNIEFKIPSHLSGAEVQLKILDIYSREIISYNIENKAGGINSIKIYSNELQPGLYIYKLYVDGCYAPARTFIIKR